MSLGVSLSGLNAAATALNVSANNVANVSTTKELDLTTGVEKNKIFTPSQTTNTSVAGGGVKTSVNPISPASVLQTNAPAVANNNDIAQNPAALNPALNPDVDLGKEAVTQIEAKNAYEANLKVLEAQNKTLEETLNIIS